MKKLRWPTSADEHVYMKFRQEQNLSICQSNPNENWMMDKLVMTGRKWSRQAQWGYRLFDFWCHELGCAVEVDGLDHDKSYDSYRDEYNFERSAIVVIRVGNMNESDADICMSRIRDLDTWNERRSAMGLKLIRT